MRTGIKIITVLAALWLSLFFLEKAYDFGLKQNRNIKMNGLTQHLPDPELLIHGPCEPLWMISPAMLDQQTGVSSYNLALSHSDFADNYLHLHQYLKYNKAPAYLLLYITPESMDARYNTFNSYRFAPYLDDPVIKETVKENDPDYAHWWMIPFMKYAYYNNKINFEVLQGYKHYLTGRTAAYYPDGFEPPTNRVWGNHAAEFAELYGENTVFRWDSMREKYLLKTIRLAKENNIRVHLYESPVFEGALAYQPNRDAMIRRIRKLALKEKIPFIQFEHLDIAQKKELYISTLNFNMRGVALFNDTLGKYLRQYILKENAYKGE